MDRKIELNGRPLRYRLKRGGAEAPSFSVGQDGTLTVTAPRGLSRTALDAWLKGREQEILDALLLCATARPDAGPAAPQAAEKRQSLGTRDWVLLVCSALLLGVIVLCVFLLHRQLVYAPEVTLTPVAASGLSAEVTPTPRPSPRPSYVPEVTATPPPAEIAADVPAEDPEPAPPEEPAAPVIWPGGYYLKVNVKANTVTVYMCDDNDEYTLPVRAMVCSTGSATPRSGLYALGWRQTWQTLFGNVYGQYVTQITGNILFHSVPYTSFGDKGSLEYWEFDKLGTSCSAGCVRLQVKDAKWVYNNRDSIVAVEFYSSSDPGPLGKPSAPKISDNKRCRGWDPSDPDPSNPWNREPTPTPELTPEPSPEETPVPSEEPEVSPEPSEEPTPEPTDTLLPDPTEPPEPSPEPSPDPTPEPEVSPEPSPEPSPTPTPSPEPTPGPSQEEDPPDG
ncbi:MAG: L,D-transpeptidase family protein [Oscillospiraceae bacterium]|nr:L,D-transpeptidase family protein [Oscillospiraceae bacterium]